MSSILKIGVVGCARILPAHLRGLKELQDKGFGDFRVTALCARRLEDAQMFRKRGRGPPPRPPVTTKQTGDPLHAPHMYISDLHDDVLPELYTDWREMLRSADVDAVLVLATVGLHHQVTLDSLRAGKHVLVEKPFAISVRAGQLMAEEARARGLTLGVAEVLRYVEGIRAQKWVLESGRIGAIQMWISGGMGAPDWSPDIIIAKTPWRHRKLEAGGGPAIDGAVHLFDILRYLCGEVEEISAIAPRLEPVRVIRDDAGRVIESVENEVEDAYFAHLRFASGAVGEVFGGVAGHGEPSGMKDGSVIYGTKGCLKGGEVILDDGQRVSERELFAAEAPAELKARWFPGGIKDGFALELLGFMRAVESGKPMETDADEGVRDLACSFTIMESATLNRPVRVADVLNGRVDVYQREINQHYGL
ncbi:MAG: Gfo/Idh/MocA family oxidoreductase [Chloroflexi bacterium]|nr:Gfo/Idh/MocA family oxidoreductase [Chloroflexota bacterium]